VSEPHGDGEGNELEDEAAEDRNQKVEEGGFSSISRHKY